MMTDWEYVTVSDPSLQTGPGGDQLSDYSSPDSYVSADKRNEISKRHWVNKERQPTCMNKRCRKKFSLIDRARNCHMCGLVFCKDCLKYLRKLSNLAHADPNGKSYQVCQVCFDEGKNCDVTTRRLTSKFQADKLNLNTQKKLHINGQQKYCTSWRDKLDLQHECDRLKAGFLKSVGTSEMKRTLQEMKTVLTTPDWQKSSNWMQESMASRCQLCSHSFGVFKKKLHCKLCGLALCKSCSLEELLVYLPDGANEDRQSGQPELAIIRVVGSPEKEPEVSLLLRVCTSCRQFVVQKQVSQYEMSLRSEVKETEDEVMVRLVTLDKVMSTLQEKSITQLSQYQVVVDSLEDSSSTSSTKSNTKSLAKAQVDLADHFVELSTKTQSVKKLTPLCKTPTQKRFINNYLKAKSDFYCDNKFTFQKLKRKLSESAPVNVLEEIQKIVDKNAIVSAQVYIRQLIYENIHLCTRHQLQEVLPPLLQPVDEATEAEACKCLVSSGDDWESHQQSVREIVRTQMTSHRLIRPSRRQLASEGASHVADIITRRSLEVLEQVTAQLDAKSLDRSFPQTKAELDSATKQVKLLKMSDIHTSK